ncbi:MAG TPA: septation protein IspZ [Caulobacteraceae bacterium]|nr:septation protein IspZ [Caulobacteraceae bacterium]
MKSLLHSAKFLAIDMASTIFFLALWAVTHNLPLSVGLGMALGVAEIGYERWRHRRIDLMQWLSLFLVLATGIATFVTRDPRFIMLKPTIIYAIVGTVMLKPGWMNRYLPERAILLEPDVGVIFGYVWCGLMYLSGLMNLYLALNYPLASYAAFMSAWALGSKLSLFLIQYGIMRAIGVRRYRAMTPDAQAAFEAAVPA